MVQHALADNMTEIKIGYHNSPLNGPAAAHAGPKPGERIVPVAGVVPPGSGATPLFALFGEKSAAAGLLEKFGGLLDSDVRPALHDGSFHLARPDGYLACSAKDPAGIASYLEGLLPAKS
jgi:hypothetical protein